MEYAPRGTAEYATLSPIEKFETLGPISLIIPDASRPSDEGSIRGYNPDL